jgi:hypothetical protein
MTPYPQSRWFSSTAFFYTHLCSEAMYHLAFHYPIIILILTGDQVLRDMCTTETHEKRRRRLQVAPSFIRFEISNYFPLKMISQH